jgi:hypothetical protein
MYVDFRNEGGDDIDNRRWKGKGNKDREKEGSDDLLEEFQSRTRKVLGWSFSLQRRDQSKVSECEWTRKKGNKSWQGNKGVCRTVRAAFSFIQRRKGSDWLSCPILSSYLIACDACLSPHYLCQMRRFVSRTPR